MRYDYFPPHGQSNGDGAGTIPVRDRLAIGVKEAAGVVGVSRSHLYEEITSKRLESFKVGKRRLILVADLEAWLKAAQMRSE